jgi:ubiquitin-conjugating enzyme E2 G1
MSAEHFGKTLLMKQFKDISKHPVDGFSIGLVDDDVYQWRVMMEGPEDTLYEGGYFPCTLTFPKEYPNSPPVMKFLSDVWHPNVYPDGRVCIFILHEAREDAYNQQELMSEKWRPILGVESILISVQSMLSEPNLESPANMDAAVQFRTDREAYRRRIKTIVRKSLDAL